MYENYNLSDTRTNQIVAKQTEKLNMISGKVPISISDPVRESMFNLEKLQKITENIINFEDDIKINKLSDIFENYEQEIVKQIEKLTLAKNNLNFCNDIINKSNTLKFFYVSIFVANPGKFEYVEYEELNNDGSSILKINMASVSKKQIQVTSDTKRIATLKMIYSNGLTANYHIKYDLAKLNKETNTIEGSFSMTR
jgi:hypothetical protein